jgi:hypothetical protein
MSRWHTNDADMLPERAFQPRFKGPFSYGMTLEGGKGGSAPNPNPGLIAQAQASERVGMRALALQQDYQNWSKSFYDELKPTLQRMADQEYEISAANKLRADEYAAYERDTFRPLEKQIVADAQNYDTEAKRNQLAGRAVGDISQAFGVVRQQAGREAASRGLNPNSGRFAALNNQLSIQEALARAGASTQARNQAEDLGYARKLDAAGLGRNLAPNASTAYGVSLNASGQAGNTAMSGGQFMSNSYGQGSNMLGQATSAYGTAGNIYGTEFNARMRGYEAQQQASGAFWGGLGSMAGGWASGGFKMGAADGGHVRKGLKYRDGGLHEGAGPVSGPGGPVDDKVPAMLSDGEYVLPADTVEKVGVKKLDRLVKETHTPAAIQRARGKRGLKGKKK